MRDRDWWGCDRWDTKLEKQAGSDVEEFVQVKIYF